MNAKVTEWLERAQADLVVVELLLKFESFPTAIAAFHCQQTAEKSLKAFLTARNVEFLFRHNLPYLLDLCAEVDASFSELEPQIAGLTPYAVEARYPTDLPLTPTRDEVQAFYQQARTILEFVRKKLTSAEGTY